MTREERKEKRQQWLEKHPRIKKVWDIILDLLGYIKRPAFFIPFLITWILLMGPFLYGGIAYIFTGLQSYYNLALHWYALTAPAFPIPVIPISSAVGIAVESIINKIKKRKEDTK